MLASLPLVIFLRQRKSALSFQLLPFLGRSYLILRFFVFHPRCLDDGLALVIQLRPDHIYELVKLRQSSTGVILIFHWYSKPAFVCFLLGLANSSIHLLITVVLHLLCGKMTMNFILLAAEMVMGFSFITFFRPVVLHGCVCAEVVVVG